MRKRVVSTFAQLLLDSFVPNSCAVWIGGWEGWDRSTKAEDENFLFFFFLSNFSHSFSFLCLNRTREIGRSKIAATTVPSPKANAEVTGSRPARPAIAHLHLPSRTRRYKPNSTPCCYSTGEHHNLIHIQSVEFLPQDKGNNGNGKAKSMVESPSKGHKRRHGEVPGGPDHHREPDNEDDRGPREKKKKNENNSEVKKNIKKNKKKNKNKQKTKQNKRRKRKKN